MKFIWYKSAMDCIYAAKRVGQYGDIFTMYKFRTMVKNADKKGGSSTSEDDPRITPVGHFLRKTKIDELPQLFNVFLGNMALIGWRPEAPEYRNTLPVEILWTKPGIVGIAQLWDFDEGAMLRGKEDPDQFYREHILPGKRSLELYYVNNQNIWLDTWILLQIIGRLLRLPVARFSRWCIAQGRLTLPQILAS